jgi:hypothetical protein
MSKIGRFGKAELKLVERMRAEAAALIGDFYALAPREWEQMRYEVRTLDELAPEEVNDRALAQVLCYDFVKRVGAQVINRWDVYRICLQDHRILRVAGFDARSAGGDKLALEPLLLYVLTHELVHIVRFSQQMQSLSLPPDLRPEEELSVDKTTWRILSPHADRPLRQVRATFSNYPLEKRCWIPEAGYSG